MAIVLAPTPSTASGAMSLLQLMQRLHREARISGAAPSTIASPNAETARLLDWINDAWRDIQMLRENWQWMRATCSFPTVLGKATYSAADIGLADWGNWTLDTWRSYNTEAGIRGECFMVPREYENWRDIWQFGANRQSFSQPIEFTVTPDKSIGLGPVPLAGYTITGDYFRAPSLLAVETDVPTLPARFHMAIIWRALVHYGFSEAAPEVLGRAEKELNRLMRMLTTNQQPMLMLGGALA